MYTFFQVASATATRYGLSRGHLGLKYDQINDSDFMFCWVNRCYIVFYSQVRTTMEISLKTFSAILVVVYILYMYVWNI